MSYDVTTPLAHVEMLEGEAVEIRRQERPNRVGGTAHDRLTVKIEAGIQHAADAGEPVEFVQQPVVSRVVAAFDDLRAAREIELMEAARQVALGTLGPDDREVLALYYVQKRTTKEIAQVMGVAPGTIMARLFRAREKLRRQMKTEDAQ